jgi:uncharacterized protein YggU (UPF0235/DUF167 family)
MQTYSILAKTGSAKEPSVEKVNLETDVENSGRAENSSVEQHKNSIQYIVNVREKPHKGEANKKIIEVFAKFLGVPKSNLEITKGHKSKYKTLSLKGC